MTVVDEFVARVEHVTGKQGKPQRGEIVLLCPAHDDHHPSLHVKQGNNGQPIAKCWSRKCSWEAICAAIGWNGSRPNEPVAVYVYSDEQGKPLIEVGRFDKPEGGKDFYQRRAGAPDWKGGIKGVRRVIYRLPDVIAGIAAGRFVFVTEGEKHADLLHRQGFVATTNPMGAKQWRPWCADMLAGARRVIVLADDDTVGREHADQVAQSLYGRVGDVRLVKLWPDGETKRDVIDFYRAASTYVKADRALVEITESTPVYVPDDTQATGTAPPGERLRLTRIADVTSKRVEWVDPERMIARRVLTGLVAPGGTVKGLYGIHQSTKLATRDERTLFVCSEDALDYIVRPRFQAAGCDARHAYALSIEAATGERVPHFPTDLPLLQQAIEEIKPALVILDPIASYIDPGLDMGKNNEMRLILQPLIALARDTDVAILAVYHLGKNRERGAIGSVAFEDACRQVLTAARDDEDEDVRHIELTKSNIGPTGYGRMLRIVAVPLEIDGEIVEVAKLVDEGRSWKHVQALLARKGAPGPEPEKRKLARDLLVEVLIASGTPGVNADEAKTLVAEKADVSLATVWRAFVELRDEKLATGQPTRDEFGSILEWRWAATLSLLVGNEGA